ncbi:putative monocarboxylate transporter mch1, partial [Rhizina undulata]
MQINAISIASEIALYLPAPFLAQICRRQCPRTISLLASICFGVGYILAAYVYINRMHFVLMMLAFFFTGAGSVCLHIAGITTLAENLGTVKGLVIGSVAYGLSPIWEAETAMAVFMQGEELKVEKMFVGFAIFFTGVSLLGALGLSVFPVRETSAVAEEEEEALLAGRREGYGSDGSNRGLPHSAEEPAQVTEVGENRNWINQATKEFLQDTNAWVFALGIFLTTGPAEAFLNNVSLVFSRFSFRDAKLKKLGAFIQSSHNHTTADISREAAHQISLFSLSSTAIRLTNTLYTGHYAVFIPAIEKSLPNAPTLRMRALIINSIVMAAGFTILAGGIGNVPETDFWFLTAFIGIGYGAVFNLPASITAVVWGSQNFEINWYILRTSAPLLGVLFYSLLFAAEYDKWSVEGMCVGGSCYQIAAGVMA